MGLEALIEPLAKWLALVAGALFLIWLVRYWIRQGAKAEKEGEIVIDLEKVRKDASDDLRATGRRMRDVWRRLRHGEDC